MNLIWDIRNLIKIHRVAIDTWYGVASLNIVGDVKKIIIKEIHDEMSMWGAKTNIKQMTDRKKLSKLNEISLSKFEFHI